MRKFGQLFNMTLNMVFVFVNCKHKRYERNKAEIDLKQVLIIIQSNFFDIAEFFG